MIKATIHFTTNTGRVTTVTKEFNGQRHIDNFVTYATTYWNNITGLDKIEYEKS